MRRDFKSACFIISEIGEPYSPERIRADRFQAVVIQALHYVNRYFQSQRGERLEIEPLRLDSDLRAHGFFDRVIEHILNARLVVAVLAGSNKNAHLECGIALAAGRPLTILVERTGEGAADVPSSGGRTARERPRRHDVPSDLSNWPCVECDISSDDVDMHAVESLAAGMIDQLLRGEPIAAFERAADRIGKQAFGKTGGVTYLDRANEFKFASWSAMLWEARSQIAIAGTSLRFLCEPDRRWFYSRDLLKSEQEGRRLAGDDRGDISLLDLLTRRALFEGIRVRLFVLSGDNPFVEHMVFARTLRDQQAKLQATRDEIRRNTQLIVSYFTPLADTPSSDLAAELDALYPEYELPTASGGSVELIEVKRGPLYSRITLTDEAAYVTPYHTSEQYNTGPAFLMSSGLVLNSDDRLVANGLYAKISEHLDDLQACNPGSTTRFSAGDLMQALAASGR